jgi:hypothetical protein
MKTGTILFFGGAVLLVLGILGGVFFIWPILTGRGSMFSNLMATVVLGALPALIGLTLITVGRKRARVEAESEERGFSEAVILLARKQGGQIGVDAVCKVSGLTRDEATAKMRELTGRGVFDIDFDPGGQMVWKLSADAGRAQLAELAGRGG